MKAPRGSGPLAFARAALLLSPALLLAVHRIDSADVWFQLATGRLVAATHRLPSHDPFGQGGVPWMVQDWLADLVLYGLHAAGGWAALVLATALLHVAALGVPLGVALHARAAPCAAREWAVLGATLLAYDRVSVRPEAFSILLAAVWCAVFARGIPRRPVAIAALCVAQVAWANLHAAFLLGPALAGLALAGRGLDRFLQPHAARTRVSRLQLALPALLLAACWINPYGPRLVVHAARAARSAHLGPLARGIVEWQPTFAQPLSSDVVLPLFLASLGAVAFAVWRDRRRIDGFGVLAVTSFAILACAARRHVALYAVTALPLAAGWSAASGSRVAGRARAALRRFGPPVVAALFAIDVARGAFIARFGPPREFGLGLSSLDHPLGAARCVAERALRGPLFNNITAGSVLTWISPGAPPVFVDGRLLDPDRFAIERRILERPRELDAGDFRLVVLGLQPYAPAGLLRHLDTSPRWRCAYRDAAGAVYVRVGS